MDLISHDRNLYIKGKRSFKTNIGGILTIIFVTCSAVLFYFIASPTFDLSAASLLEYTMSAEEVSKIPIPPVKIIYGFPKANASNLEILKILDGPTQTILELQDYSDSDWDLHFNFSKDPNLVYKYHNWVNESSIIELVQIIPVSPTNVTPTRWYCYSETGWAVPIRLNEFGDSECLSSDGIISQWGEKNDEDCHQLLTTYLPKFNPLSCGIHHLLLWGITGYDTPTHWCAVSLKTLMALNPNKTFLTFDSNLTYSRIFMAIEQMPFNEVAQDVAVGHLILSDLENPFTFAIALKRSVSKISLKKGFFSYETKVLYPFTIDFRTKMIRKELSNIIFKYDIVEDASFVISPRTKEYTFKLIIDLIAITSSLVMILYFFLFLIKIFVDEYLLKKFVYQQYNKNKNKMDDFTFSNYVRLKLFNGFWSKTNKSFSDFKTKIQEVNAVMSVESFLSEKFEPKTKSVIENFFCACDCFAVQQSFYINGHKNYRTNLGYLLTFLYIISLPILFVLLGQDFLYGKNPNKIIYNEPIRYGENLKSIYTDVPYLIYYSSWIDPYTTLLYNNVSVSLSYYENVPIESYPTKCTDKEIASFKLTKMSNLVYYCGNAESLINYHNDNGFQIRFALAKCYTLTNYTWLNLNNCDMTNPDPFNTIPINFGFSSKAFDIAFNGDVNQYKTDQITTLTTKKFVFNDGTNFNYMHFIVENIEWIDDTDLISTSTVVDKFLQCQGGDAFLLTYQNSNGQEFILTMYEIKLSNTSMYALRSFPKILMVFNKVILVALLIKMFLKAVYALFENYILVKHFLPLFCLNFDMKKLRLDMHKINEKNLEMVKNHVLNQTSDEIDDESFIKELQNSIFCLKNHILMNLRVKDENVLKYEFVYEKIIFSLSYEQIVLKKNMIKFRTLLERFDFFPSLNLFLVNFQRKYKTIFGGLVSILLLGVSTFVIVYIGNDFFKNTHPTVNIQSLYYNETDLNYWRHQKGTVMVYKTKLENDNSTFVLTNYITEQQTEIQPDSCDQTDFDWLKVTKNNNFEYACVDIWNILGWNHNETKDIVFFGVSVTNCPQWKDFAAASANTIFSGSQLIFYDISETTCPSKQIIPSVDIEVGVYMRFKYFEQEQFGLEDLFVYESNINNNGDMLDLRYEITENQLLDDVGKLFSNVQTEFFATIVEGQKELMKGWNNGNFGRFLVEIYQNQVNYNLYKRNYMKFQDFMNQAFTLIGIVHGILGFIILYFSDYQFLRNFLNDNLKFIKERNNNIETMRSSNRTFIMNKSIVSLKNSKIYAKNLMYFQKPTEQNQQISIQEQKKKIEKFNLKNFIFARFFFFIKKKNMVFQNIMSELKDFLSIEKVYCDKLDPNQLELKTVKNSKISQKKKKISYFANSKISMDK